MARKPVIKNAPARALPDLPQHILPEPLCRLQNLGFDEEITVYTEICLSIDKQEADNRIAKLIDMAGDESYYSYLDPDLNAPPDPRVFTPLHAIRTLCYFGEFVAPSLNKITHLFDSEDDNVREELPTLMSCIGKEAIEPLTKMTLDVELSVGLREGAGESLVAIAEELPETRSKAIETIELALSKCDDEELAGYFVLQLMDLGSPDSLPLIEHTFRLLDIDEEIVRLEEVREFFEMVENTEDDPESDGEEATNVESTVADSEIREPFVAKEKVGRNELCPCGSGKKFKKCCGA